MERKTTHFTQGKSEKGEHDNEDIDPFIIKKFSAHERMAEEMKRSGVDSEALPLGSHPLEHKQYYSQTFSMSPKLITNKGLVKIKSKNIDFVQLLQRN